MTIWKILIWKEWHEHKWKLLALTAILMSVYLAMLSEDLTMPTRDSGDVLFALMLALLAHTLFAPLFIGMSVCTAEHASRSIEFIRAQPFSLKEAARVRFVMGAVLLIVPIIVCYLCSVLFVTIWPGTMPGSSIENAGLPGSWSIMRAMTAYVGIGIGASLNAYAWVTAVMVNQRTEFRAGLIGLVTIVLIVLIGASGMSGWDNEIKSGRVSIPYLAALMSTPLAYMGMVDFIRQSRSELIFFALVWQAVLTVHLSRLAIRRYGYEPWFAGWQIRVDRPERDASRVLGRPLASPWWALFWMQMRQTLPVGLVGLAVVCLTTLVVDPRFNPQGWHAFVGSLLALLIGVGSFVHELEPKLHTFWRSRPISPSAWFWLKFTAGFVVLVVLFDLPYFLLAWGQYIYPWSAYRPEFAIPLGSEPPSLIIALFPVLMHLFVYSLAVLAACAIRHSVYSTVIAVCVVLAFVLLPEVNWVHLPQRLSFFDLWTSAYRFNDWRSGLSFAIATALVTAIALPATLLAVWLVKRDIAINA